MSIITISRGSFSGGKMLAECLCRRLGYRCIDRDVIVESAAARGVSQDELRDALMKPPTFLERLQHKKYMYLVLIQAALAEEVRTGQAVYHGNAGHLLLKGGPHILRVRIIAPMEFRVAMARARLKLTRGEAIAYIHGMDQDRMKWTHYLYGVDWGDPAQYDIVLNLEFMSIPESCSAVAALVKERCFEFTPDDRAAMDDLALASSVRAELALHESTSHLEVEIKSKRGAVTIHGRAASLRDIEAVCRLAGSLPGVSSVNVDEMSTSALL
jgi:cytidylate kinase